MSAEVIVLRPLAYDFDSAAERAALDRLIADCHAILALERQGLSLLGCADPALGGYREDGTPALEQVKLQERGWRCWRRSPIERRRDQCPT